MSKIAEIESAIEQLSPEEQQQLRKWLLERGQTRRLDCAGGAETAGVERCHQELAHGLRRKPRPLSSRGAQAQSAMTPVFADSFFFFALLNNDAAHEARGEVHFANRPPLCNHRMGVDGSSDGCASVDKRGVFLQLLDAWRASPDARIIGPPEELFWRGLDSNRQRRTRSRPTDCVSFVAMGDERISEALSVESL